MMLFCVVTEFATALTAALAATNQSLREVSRIAEIHSSFLSRMASGAMAPSAAALQSLCQKLNPEIFPELGRDYGPELLISYLRDCAKDSGLDTEALRISLSGSVNDRWDEFPPSLAERLFAIGKGCLHDKEFMSLVADLEPIALKLQAAKIDTAELTRLKRAAVYSFPSSKTAVTAAHPQKPAVKGRYTRPATAFPHGASQEPTA